MEVIGTYDPIPKLDPYANTGQFHKDIKLDVIRAKYWIGVGAQPSDTAWRILSMVSFLSYTALVFERRCANTTGYWGVLYQDACV